MQQLTFVDLAYAFEGTLEQRAQTSGRHIATIAHERNARTILDTASGLGYDAKHLITQGFDVDINEYDPAFMRETERTLQGMPHQSFAYDWRELSRIGKQYDLLFCVGNGLTYLHEREDQLRALDEMRKTLVPGGTLIIDQRNYEAMREGMRLQNKLMYCGDVLAMPTSINANNIRMTYRTTDSTAHLDLYPFKMEELRELLHAAGFSDVMTLANWGPMNGNYDENTFFEHIASKPI